MKKWYAVQKTSEDAWDYGSADKAEAVKMLKEQGHGLIAVIDVDDNFCIDEIRYEDLEEEDEKMTKEMMILMATGMTEHDAERHIKKGCTIWENPDEYIENLKDCGVWEGQTVEGIRSGSDEPDVDMVTYEGHEYLVEYVL